MHVIKQSTAFTDTIGPILDSTGAEYTGAVIGDLSISKNGTEAAMAAAATLTHISNGHYTLVGTTGNSDTLGRIVIRCNKSTYQMPPVRYEVLSATTFDAIVTNAAGASGGLVYNGSNTGTVIPSVTLVATTTDVTNRVRANLEQINGTSIPGTSTRVAAGFESFFNVASPTLTIASVNQTGNVYPLVDTEVAAILAAIDTEIADIQARLPAALTADGNIKADSLRISGSDTAANNLETIFDTDYASVYNTTAKCLLAQLDDGVTHGGTTALFRLGSSTSTPAFYVTNSAGDATKFEVTAGTGHGLHASGRGASQAGINAVATSSSSHGIIATGFSGGAGMKVTGGTTGSGFDCRAGATSGYGALFWATGDAAGLWIRSGTAATTAAGITVQGYGTAGGLDLTGFNSNPGLSVVSAGNAAVFTSSSSGSGITATGAGSGYDIDADIHGTLDTVTTYTGNTPQTGDAYARLGAPAGASVSADVAAVKTDTGNLVTRITSTLFSGITSMAQWLGLLAGKQTGNSTARTEIRATGGGSGTYDETTDSQEALRDRGDAAWVTATGFSTHTAADVWAVATRVLTAGTNIVLAKGTGVTGFTDLSAAQVNAEVDTALADYDGPTNAEMVARTIVSASYATSAAQTTAQNDLDILTGSDGVTLATSQPNYAPATATALASLVTTVGAAGAGLTAAGITAAGVRSAIGLASANLDTQLDALPTNAELATALGTADDATLAAIAALNNISTSQVTTSVTTALTTAVAEGYRSTNATGSIRDILYEILAVLTQADISGVTMTTRKLDGTTVAKTYTLSDASVPTSITEAT